MRTIIYRQQGMSALILKLILVVSFACMAMMAQAQATISTDQLDYPPGSTAIITGTGFQPGEEVELHVHHVGEDSLGTDPQYHQPWTVIADAEGNFTTSWYVPTDGDALGATFNLEAHGNLGSEAEWIFTDGITGSTPNDVTVPCEGGTAKFLVTVNAPGNYSGTTTFQWYQSTNGGATFSLLSNGGVYSGVTSAELTINGVTSAMNGYKYRVIVTQPGLNGSPFTSRSAALTVSNIQLTAAISATQNIVCYGSSTNIQFDGTPNATITYAVNGGGPQTVTLNNGGNGTLSSGALTSQATYSLISVAIGSCSQSASGTVIVSIETVAPVISNVPANIVVSNDLGVCQALVNWTLPTATDNCTISSVTSSHNPDSAFPVGTTTVTYTAVDNAGNSSNASFTVTVNDTEAPGITAAADVTVSNDAGSCSAVVELAAPTTSDNCGVAGITSDAPAVFEVGTTIVTWTVTDIHGNSSTDTQTVTVNDTESPAITAAADVTVSNDAGSCLAVVELAAPATSDNCGVAGVTSDAPAVFEVGTTIVTWTATDIHGNSSTDTQTVTVNDTESPTIVAAGDVIVSNDAGECSAVVVLAAPATSDNCGMASITSDAPTVFEVGTTVVTWTVTDIHGNSSTDTQTVTVNDTEFPAIIAAADIIVSNDAGECSAVVVLAAPVTSDNCGVAGVTSDAPSVFEVGTTIVTWTATDIHGNISTDTQTVTVNDTESPVITVADDVTVSNDAGLCSAVVVLTAPATSDNCGVVGVTNDAPVSFPVGTTAVTWTVTDIHGNISTDTQTVTVNDTEFPTIVGMPSNITLSACTSTASWNTPVASDNCSATLTGSGPASGSTFANGSITTITYTATDAAGNQTSSSFTVSRPAVLSASSSSTAILCYGGTSTVTVSATGGRAPYSGTGNFPATAGTHTYLVTDADGCTTSTSITITQPSELVASTAINNAYMYFGYSGDQSGTVTVTPSGGVGPYTVSVTMNRALKCNIITTSGDETWTASGATNINTSCPSSGAGLIPVSTKSLSSGSFSLNVILMEDAILIATITDANGCVTTREVHVDAEDVRCFAGTSMVQKVQICHKTGNSKNPCVTICVDESAVAEHIAHGDFYGKCNSTCTAPVANARIASDEMDADADFNVSAFPNPFKSTLTIQVNNPENREVNMHMMDMTGRNMDLRMPKPTEEGMYVLETDHIQPGLYFMKVNIGKFSKTIKVFRE
jgi:hypothetical protein